MAVGRFFDTSALGVKLQSITASRLVGVESFVADIVLTAVAGDANELTRCFAGHSWRGGNRVEPWDSGQYPHQEQGNEGDSRICSERGMHGGAGLFFLVLGRLQRGEKMRME